MLFELSNLCICRLVECSPDIKGYIISEPVGNCVLLYDVSENK